MAKAGLEQLMITLAAEHKKTDLNLYTAKLETFATEARGRLFPGENPLNLTSAESMAQRILESLLQDKQHSSITLL